MRTLLTCVLVASVTLLTGCANKNLTPDQTATETAKYADAAVDLVTAVQQSINVYAQQNGRNAPLDAASVHIRDRFIPAAERLHKTLDTYVAVRRSGVPSNVSDEQAVKEALDRYEQTFEELTDIALPDGLVSTTTDTYFRIRELIKAVRENVLTRRSAIVLSPQELRAKSLTAEDVIVWGMQP